MKKDRLEYKEYFYYLNLVFELSWVLVAFILGLGAVGFVIDKFLFGKAGVFFVVGLVLGVLSGFYYSYRMIMKKIEQK